MLKSQNISHALCALQLAQNSSLGSKKWLIGDVPILMPRHYQIANNQKEKELKMFQKKNQTVSIANFQLLIDQFLKWLQFQPNGTKIIQWFFLRSKDLFTQSCPTFTQNLSHNVGLASLRCSHSDSLSLKCSHRMDWATNNQTTEVHKRSGATCIWK